MHTRKLEIEIPSALCEYLQMDDEKITNRLFKLLLADISRQGLISFGKAAEIAGIDKMEFIIEVSEMGIPYFCEDISEVIADAETVNQTMVGIAS